MHQQVVAASGLLMGFLGCWMLLSSQSADKLSLLSAARLANIRLPVSKAEAAVLHVHPSRKSLREIFADTKTDKGSTHGFWRTYESVFAPFRFAPKVRVLEIGAEHGRSMEAWDRYFEEADQIVGIAYGDAMKPAVKGKVTVERGSQNDRSFLQGICSKYGPFDIIIDDGGHVPADIIVSFEELITCMKAGGIYTIEDVETSYWNKPGATVYDNLLPNVGLGMKGSVVERFKGVADTINRNFFLNDEYSVIRGDHNIASITFANNLIVMRKVSPLDAPYSNRPYLWADNVIKQGTDNAHTGQQDSPKTTSDGIIGNSRDVPTRSQEVGKAGPEDLKVQTGHLTSHGIKQQ